MGGMTKDERLDMRIAADLKKALTRLAELENRKVTNYVETVLREHVAEREKAGRRK